MMTKQEIINARTGAAPVRNIHPADRTDAIEALLKRAYALKGYSSEDEAEKEIKTAGQELLAKIDTRWSFLTFGEIWLALETGICGEFTKDTRLTLANYYQWLSAYVSTQERHDALREIEDKAKEATMLPAASQEQVNEAAGRNGVMKQWQIFKETGACRITFDGYAAMLYDYLDSKGKINARPETISAARERARQKTDKDGCLEYAIKRELLTMYFSALRQNNIELRL